ncbi:unnamed protein product [Brassica oleracea var. botrytis]
MQLCPSASEFGHRQTPLSFIFRLFLVLLLISFHFFNMCVVLTVTIFFC